MQKEATHGGNNIKYLVARSKQEEEDLKGKGERNTRVLLVKFLWNIVLVYYFVSTQVNAHSVMFVFATHC